MKKISLIFILLLSSIKIIFSQINLIPNSSFENYSVCPTSPGQIYYCDNWFQPNKISGSIMLGSSSDYYNSCSSIGNTSVPSNTYSGHQVAKNGNSYIGVALYNSTAEINREYIETKLNEKLIQGKKYCITAYLSLADTSSTAISNIDFLFSEDSILYSSLVGAPISETPQTSNNISNIIIDKTNWTKMELFYTALGNEQFLTIGNFQSNAATNSQTLSGYIPDAYYYIDDLSLICCDCVQEEISLPNAFSPNGDGHNDVFRILGDADKVDLRIFNRWGEEVFYTNDISVGWNGTYKGNELNNGVFFYILNAVTKSGKEVELKGNVTLLK